MTFEIALLGPCSLVLRSFGGFYLQTNAAKVVGTVHSTLQVWERTSSKKSVNHNSNVQSEQSTVQSCEFIGGEHWFGFATSGFYHFGELPYHRLPGS